MRSRVETVSIVSNASAVPTPMQQQRATIPMSSMVRTAPVSPSTVTPHIPLSTTYGNETPIAFGTGIAESSVQYTDAGQQVGVEASPSPVPTILNSRVEKDLKAGGKLLEERAITREELMASGNYIAGAPESAGQYHPQPHTASGQMLPAPSSGVREVSMPPPNKGMVSEMS